MSDSSSRGGLWVAVAIVVGLLGIAAWFTVGGVTTPERTPSDGHAISKPAPVEAPDTIGFKATDQPAVTPLTPKPADVAPRPGTLTEPVVAAPLPAGTHVVARGHVRWAGGEVPYESDVKLFDAAGDDLDLTYTDAEGAFELVSDEPLAAGWSFGTDVIEVMHKGVIASLAPSLVSNLPLHRPGDPPVERDLIVGFAPVITGRVVDKRTQLPIEDAEVYVASSLAAYSYDSLDTLTGPDGRYLLEVEDMPLTGLLIWCRADDHQAVLAGPLDLQPVASPTDVVTQDFALSEAVTVRGRVTDARTGEPIDGAIITVGSRHQAFTDLNDFDISTEEGLFEIEASEIPVEGGWLVFNATDFAAAVLPLERGAGFVDVALGEPFVVAGIVVDEAGRAVPHARIEFAFDGDTAELDQDMFDQADCDRDGRFEETLEMVPDRNVIVRVDSIGKLPFRARLADIGRLLGGQRWEMEIRLQSE